MTGDVKKLSHGCSVFWLLPPAEAGFGPFSEGFDPFTCPKAQWPLFCILNSMRGGKVSEQAPLFHFVPEEKPPLAENTERQENRVFFVNLICISVLSAGSVFGLFSTSYPETHKRNIQSLTPTDSALSKQIDLRSFVVRLKTEKGFRLSRVQVTLGVKASEALREEIDGSLNEIQDHLLFILSDKQSVVFQNPEQLELLKKEIISHLNLFLVAGKIETVELKKTFLQ